MKKFLKDKNRMLIIGLAVAVLLCGVGYALTVDKFTDYNPPTTLTIRWGDYMLTSGGSYALDNKTTEFPRWSAAYPYRIILYGAAPCSHSNHAQSHEDRMYVIYSKTPSTDLFTFEYIPAKNSRYGYIRAYIPLDKLGTVLGNGEDIVIAYQGQNGVQDLRECFNVTDWPSVPTYQSIDNGRLFFDFDFYYECAGEHQQNAYPLNINGLRSIANVPYAYILKCDGHGSPAGSTSGGSSSTGGGSSGGSSQNSSGYGGNHGWGGGSYGGGVDKGSLSSQSDGGGYSSSSGMDLSVPDDWTKPVEDDYNGGSSSEYKPDYPAYVPAEGDSGQDGSDWQLPSFNLGGNLGVSGEVSGYKELKPNGEQGYIEFKPHVDNWGYIELRPDAQQGLIDFMNPGG